VFLEASQRIGLWQDTMSNEHTRKARIEVIDMWNDVRHVAGKKEGRREVACRGPEAQDGRERALQLSEP
jgi:hypothetical protein